MTDRTVSRAPREGSARAPADADPPAVTAREIHRAEPATDFMFDAGRRVSIAALAVAALWLVVAVLANFTLGARVWSPALRGAWGLFGNEVAAGFIAVSLVLAWGARRLAGRPDLVLRLGLGYEVLGAVAVAALTQWGVPDPGRGVSWNCVGILLFPAIVPARPRPVLVASLLAASAEPIAYLLARRAGVADPPLEGFAALWAFLPSYICAGVAVVPASIVRRLGQAAREGSDLGSYRLGSLLGSGGMGQVYHASHRLLARPAAVKVISPTHLSGALRDVMIQRFHREAASAASLRSPHTIDLYDFGVARDGTLYYAMELLDGLDLQSLVRDHGPVEPARVVHFLRQACLSLAEAHQQGFVHRDVKPSNLMICRLGTEVDFVKVLDFGLVKVLRHGRLALTESGLAAGTPEYMAPESLDGEVDHRADLYALGCVAYWLLSGRHLFQGRSAMAVLLQHGTQLPPPLVSPVRPIPPDLEAVVSRCLAKDPEHRFADALEMEEALGASCLASAWTPAHARAWWATHRSEKPAAA